MVDQATLLLDGFTLTEAPRWHDGRIWFSDLYTNRVLSATESGADLRVEAQLTGIPVGKGWLPDGRMIVVVQDEARIMRREPDGTLVQHADLSKYAVGFPNDMAITVDGVAFVGCFGFDLYAGSPVAPGPLMRITPDGVVTIVGEPLYFANGPTIVGGKTLVIAESFGNRLSAFDILGNGDLGPRRNWATFGPLPTTTDLQERFDQAVFAADGISSVDDEGAIWAADFTKTVVSRVMPGGEIIEQVSTGDLNCFAAELGGSDGRTLFLCGAPDELDIEIHKRERKGVIMTHRASVPAASS